MTSIEDRLKQADEIYRQEILKVIENASLGGLYKIAGHLERPAQCPAEVFNLIVEKAVPKANTFKKMKDLLYFIDQLPRNDDLYKSRDELVSKMCTKIKKWEVSYQVNYHHGHKKFIFKMLELMKTGNQAWNTWLYAKSRSDEKLQALAEEMCPKIIGFEEIRDRPRGTLLPIKAD